MTYRGIEIKTHGDVMSIVSAISKEGSKEEAQAFLTEYSKINPSARSNINYMAGYCDDDLAKKIRDWF